MSYKTLTLRGKVYLLLRIFVDQKTILRESKNIQVGELIFKTSDAYSQYRKKL